MTAELGTPAHAEDVTAGRHPGTRDGLLWLCFSHLPQGLQNHARPFYQTAVELVMANVDGPELVKALNALTESKDWAVRAGIRTDTGRAGPVPRPAEVVDPPSFGPAADVVGRTLPVYPTGVEPYSEAGRLASGRPIRDNPQA